MKLNKVKIKKYIRHAVIATSVMLGVCAVPMCVGAEERYEVPGLLYDFDRDSNYNYQKEEMYIETNNDNTVGSFSVSGDFYIDDTKEIPTFYVNSGSVGFNYEFDKTLFNVDIDEWHIGDDGKRTIAGSKVNKKIGHGAILLQSSKDGEKWQDEVFLTDLFNEENETDTMSFFETSDIQLINGCYYRVVVAYMKEMRTKEVKVLKDKYDYKKYAEVYEFFVQNDPANPINAITPDVTPKITDLGELYNTGKDNGFSEKNALEEDDPHYGWDLGEFSVNGYTRSATDDNGKMVFIKNVGDKVTLWFHLMQDIEKLNGNEKLLISEDTNGYNKELQTVKTNLKHGALIISYTDYTNKTQAPIIYTNFLEASTSTGADTRVQLFEEGDYKVVLDYEILDKSGIKKEYTNYEISFEFSVRNGNCMVYPFDLETGAELADNAVVSEGFRLDLAKSRYLEIDIKREVLNEGKCETDTRFNAPAKDGAEYTDEGIYTFKVKNLYTNETTVKKIYVGTEEQYAELLGR